MSDGFFFVSDSLVGPAKITIGEGRPRIELDGLNEVGDGAVELSLLVVGATPLGVGGVIIGLSSMALVKSAMALSNANALR